MQNSKLQIKVQNYKRIKRLLPEIKTNIPLKNYTTFKIGGPAKYFFEAKTKEDLIKAVKTANELKLPFFILGGGSNILVADKGYDGLVIKAQSSKLKTTAQNHSSKLKTIYVDSGVSLSNLISFCLDKSLTGMEWAVGIPGATVGGAIKGNAGAFGQSMKDITKTVTVLEIPNHKLQITNKFQTKTFKNKDCKFKYRDSIFKHNKNLIILSTEIELKKGDKEAIKKRVKENLKWRKDNQSLDFSSAGSVFQNPALEQGSVQDGAIQYSAGWLIEQCGLKGKKAGKAQISKKHANFIINSGSAKAQDVMKLINLAKKKVKEKFGIDLKEEIVILNEAKK